MSSQNDDNSGFIFRMWFRHYRTGKIIRAPYGRPFRIPIKGKKPKAA